MTDRTERPQRAGTPGTLRIGRRALLAGVGVGGLAAATTGATPDRPGEAPAQPDDQPVYRETDHIRQFYARSRF